MIRVHHVTDRRTDGRTDDLPQQNGTLYSVEHRAVTKATQHYLTQTQQREDQSCVDSHSNEVFFFTSRS